MQSLTLTLIAAAVSVGEIESLLEGCARNDISGTINTDKNWVNAQNLLDELNAKGIPAQNAGVDNTLPSTITIKMYVPTEQRERVIAWADRNIVWNVRWGVSVGDRIEAPEPIETTLYNHCFAGSIIGFQCGYAQVEDGDGDVFDIEVDKLNAEFPQNLVTN